MVWPSALYVLEASERKVKRKAGSPRSGMKLCLCKPLYERVKTLSKTRIEAQ